MKKIVLLIATLAATLNAMSRTDVVEQLDSLFEARYSDVANKPGGAVLIARGDSVIYERYFGVADMNSGERIGPETLFNIASVSKQFTVIGLLQQVEKGEVKMEDAVSEYMDYPQKFWKYITLADLAGHTSGVADSRDRSSRERCIYATDETSISYFKDVEKLQFSPGTAYDYLNPSFLILAKIIEQKSGEKFVDYQRHHIFEPAGMQNAVYFNPDTMPAHTAHGYEPNDKGGWNEFDYGEETFFATRPDGGIYATARDMLHWELALQSNKLLNAKLRDMAYRPRIRVSDSEWCDYQRRPHTWYGQGWFIDTTPGCREKVYHTGDNGGFQAYVAKYPANNTTIIVLENRHDQERWPMAEAIDKIIGR
jgi:CubicO group peptidase (beta-lactamase class C family)